MEEKDSETLKILQDIENKNEIIKKLEEENLLKEKKYQKKINNLEIQIGNWLQEINRLEDVILEEKRIKESLQIALKALCGILN